MIMKTQDFPERTREHFARISRRRDALAAELASCLPDGVRIVLEIGCGHGHFLSAYAGAHPRELCVGIDIDSQRIERAARKRDRAGLDNLHFLRAEARLFLEVMPAGVMVRAFFMLFPDPWPKLRHHKHRLLKPDFLDAAGARAEAGALFCFRTDFEPYYREARDTFAVHPRWRLTELPWPFELVTVFQQRAASFNSLIAMHSG